MKQIIRKLVFLAVLHMATTAHAQTLVKITAGTGFFINRDGDVVTNAHVVHNCQSITIRTTSGDRTASVKARDEGHDLAVLRVSGSVPEIAPLRWNISDLQVGDPVIVMGYPGSEGVNYHYAFRKTTVMGLAGPTGEPNWLQLGNVAEHGNSGGPVLDPTGHVIAVITGKAKTYRVDTSNSNTHIPPALIGESDVAITLAALKDFLQNNSVLFYQSTGGTKGYADSEIERQARQFIVPVRCILGAAN